MKKLLLLLFLMLSLSVNAQKDYDIYNVHVCSSPSFSDEIGKWEYYEESKYQSDNNLVIFGKDGQTVVLKYLTVYKKTEKGYRVYDLYKKGKHVGVFSVPKKLWDYADGPFFKVTFVFDNGKKKNYYFEFGGDVV